MKEENVLTVENLVTSFNVSGREVNAVDDCSFHVKKGKTLGIVGESGCGKSVTSLSIMRLIPTPPGKIKSGKILFGNKNILDLQEKEMRSIRGNKISMIFQEPMTSLNPVYTIGNQIAEVFQTHKKVSQKEAQNLSIEMLKQVRIPSPEKRIHDYPHQLSGGMRQRVMIAIALACKPALLIADEPTTALDVTIQAQILALMNNLQEDNGMSTILITHDLGVVAETCDDVVVMYAGKIVEKASTKEIFTNPKHPYTIGLLNSIPRLGEKKDRLNTIPGIVPSLTKLPKGCRFQDRCSIATEECKISEPLLNEVEKNKFVACIKA
ncbi:ABC transporter ATP-binding protein [Pigmentibacter sp. JX0631]|uniref:ABC transporter ATP-binding protein n=1 Tax=Pigmentibacter sp. JX0631 TaxID=2976982 RepID=UPI00246857C9|nr:ABC transporter ATP-binding protein [Pigmentibacter sp. JX0631]WGL61370.1 ABC transporter ATP-binding protein [Pigmentibacter sp. JX0631]